MQTGFTVEILKMKRLILQALLAVVTLTVHATVKVSFKATDDEETGEPFATVRIYATSDTTRAVIIDVTDIDGKFTHDIMPGSYSLHVSAVGKVSATRDFTATDTDVDLGIITLRGNDNVLEGVTVTAARPLITTEVDRIGYDVQADADSKTSTVMDLLRKVPLVSVDAQDNILVKGSSNFKIYKNGHPDPSLSNNAKEVLKAIPASMIKKIEVITEPGAKYDAEGVAAILNIVTVTTSQMGGATGTVSAGVDNYGSVSGSAYLTAQVKKVISNINYGVTSRPRRAQQQNSHSEYYYPASEETAISNNVADARVNVHYANIEASYEPDTLNLVTLNFGGYYYYFNGNANIGYKRIDASGTALYSYNTVYSTPLSSYYSFDGRLDYQHRTHRPDEILTLSYLLSTSRDKRESQSQFTDMVSMPVPYSAMYQTAHEKFLEQTAQIDWTRPLAAGHKIDTGLKYINRANRSNTTATYTGGGNDVYSRFNHTTHVAAAYVSYTYSSERWDARAGLRYEYSYLAARYPDGSQPGFHRTLNDWVPSASVNYKFDMFRSLKAAFSTRINRPGISFLNPAVIENVQEVNYGNAALGSARTYSVSLTYMQVGPKFTFNIVPGFSSSTNQFTEVKFTDDAGRDVTTYDNAMVERWYGISGFAQWQFHAKTSLMFNGNIGRNYLRSTPLGLRNARWASFFYTQFSWQMPLQIRLTATVGKWGGDADGLYARRGTTWFHGLGLQRSFLKDDRLTVKLRTQNPFGGRYFHNRHYTIHGDYTGVSDFAFTGRYFQLTVSYRFGSLKASVKKTATTIDNSDLVGGNKKSSE